MTKFLAFLNRDASDLLAAVSLIAFLSTGAVWFAVQTAEIVR